MDGAVLLRSDDHSHDLIVHFLNQVSRLLDCDSAQDFKAEGCRCQMRDSVMEHFHLNCRLSLAGFPQIETARAAFDGHNPLLTPKCLRQLFVALETFVTFSPFCSKNRTKEVPIS